MLGQALGYWLYLLQRQELKRFVHQRLEYTPSCTRTSHFNVCTPVYPLPMVTVCSKTTKLSNIILYEICAVFSLYKNLFSDINIAGAHPSHRGNVIVPIKIRQNNIAWTLQWSGHKEHPFYTKKSCNLHKVVFVTW